MPAPAIVNPTLFRGANGTTQGAIRPVRVGFRPFTERTRGKRYARLVYARNSANATPNFGNVGVLGIELPYQSMDQGANSLGQRLPGFNPNTGTPGVPLQTGSYTETIVLSGGAATGIGLITVLDGGADYTAAPTVVFTPATGAPAATAIIRDRRVVGITITAAGGPFTTPPVITFTGGGTPTRVAQASCGVGQQLTVNTHIPFLAHAPLAAGGQFWFITVNDRIIMCSTSAVAAFNNADDGVLDPDQHIMGTAANAGFTVATGTHPDGTTAIGVLTLAQGLPNNTRVSVYSGLIRELSAQGTHYFDDTQIKLLDLMYAVVGAAGDNSNSSIDIRPAFGN